MGFLEKMKNLFTEEEEIVEPVKKEVMQVEIKAPTKREEKTEIREEKVSVPEKPAPVFFDDKDFDTLEPPKPPKKNPQSSTRKAKKTEEGRPVYQNTKKMKEKRGFKPSPIISPVYGVLDQNYKKEDIVHRTKTDGMSRYKSTRDMTLDEVRKRAFGTLEDEINSNLDMIETLDTREELNFQDEGLVDVMDDVLETDIFEEMDNKEEDPMHIEFENEEDDITLGNIASEAPQVEENLDLVSEALENIEQIEQVEPSAPTKKEEKESLEDSELFDLIDSMYEKRDEK